MAALQRTAEARRDRFILALTEKLQEADGPIAMMQPAAEMLGRHLRVAQVGFGDVFADQMHVRV